MKSGAYYRADLQEMDTLTYIIHNYAGNGKDRIITTADYTTIKTVMEYKDKQNKIGITILDTE